MQDKKIIAIVGATGAQGGGLARAILDDPDGGFAVRAITRNVGSDKAKALAARGAEVVAADLDDEASLERAFRCIISAVPLERGVGSARRGVASRSQP